MIPGLQRTASWTVRAGERVILSNFVPMLLPFHLAGLMSGAGWGASPLILCRGSPRSATGCWPGEIRYRGIILGADSRSPVATLLFFVINYNGNQAYDSNDPSI